MRISVIQDDPGYHPACVFSGTKVFFEGAEIGYVFTADEEKREVLVARLDASGNLTLTKDRQDFAVEKRYGHVRIELSEALRKIMALA